LSHTLIINCELSNADINIYTDFSHAATDDPDFLQRVREKGLQNIPYEITNKQELRKELLQRHVGGNIETWLELSNLPEN
jgi:hypothetical protein